MADSIDVLVVLKLVYTVYAFIAISVVAWLAYRLTKPAGSREGAKAAIFWVYVILLAVIGTGLHILTYNVVPWVKVDLGRADIGVHKTFEIRYKNHQMTFSEMPMRVECNTPVVFNAISDDLVYGFGIFRNDNTMVSQMQVVPHNRNDLMWKFHKNGIYYVRSTEYSGPRGAAMIRKNAIVVSGCPAAGRNTENVGGEKS